ncbi:hypothetical protein PMALA_059210, partial [Plasmodium malariae]
EISLEFAGKGSLLHHIGLDKEYLKTLADKGNGPWSPFVGVLKIFGDLLQHSVSGAGAVQCGWCESLSSVSEMLSLLYQEFFITIKKLKNMKKLNSKKDEVHNNKFCSFCIDVSNMN